MENSDFFSDKEKMVDFAILTKEEFLASYSYLTESEYDNTRRIVIEELQSDVQHNRIADIDGLREKCESYGKANIDAYEDVLHPMEYNTCDRCGDIYDSETGFFWVDGFEWDEDREFDKAVLKSMADEGVDYCAMCYDCLHELANNGRDVKEVAKAKKYYEEEYVEQIKNENGSEPVCFDEFYWNDWQEIKGLLK